MKTFDLDFYGKIYPIQLSISTYPNGNLAIPMTAWNNGKPEPWNVLTVNLGRPMKKNHAFIDTNNNGNDILAWIVRHGLAVPTGVFSTSGFCCYPEYRFRSDCLQEFDPDGYAHYFEIWDSLYGG